MTPSAFEDASRADAGSGPDPGRGNSDPGEQGDDELKALRSLLLSPEQRQIAALTQQLADLNRAISAQDVSQVLPEAIELRGADDTRLPPALQPTIERAIDSSVRTNPRVLTDAMFPILGPMIRRSTAVAIEGLFERTRLALEQAFSLRGWRWRVEALVTGKKFEDVVLLNSLVYSVEQVFLIHLETGLLLMHVSAATTQSQGGVRDVDLVSGMLTAIQDFVRDSFQMKEGEALETVQVGELTVWMERGPYAVVAGVVRGNAPQSVRAKLRAAVETCHRDYAEALRSYSGDSSLFEGMRPHLLECMQSQYAEEKKLSGATLALVVTVSLLAIMTLLGIGWWREHKLEQRWQLTVAALERTPGVVLTEAKRNRQRYQVLGLRDPGAEDARAVVSRYGIDPSLVDFHLTPYLSLEPPLVEKRVRAMLHPPDSVTLRLDGTVLTATGTASPAWVSDTRVIARAIPGVSTYRDEVRELIQSPDLRILLAQVTADLQKQHLSFLPLTSTLKPDQDAVLGRIIQLMNSMRDLSQKTDEKIELQVIGYADQSPEQEAKNHLGERRAQSLVETLRQRGMELSNVRVIGVGAVDPEVYKLGAKPEHPENWAVGFKAAVKE